MSRAHVTRAQGGEYSTVIIGDAYVETMWFGDDGSTATIGRTLIDPKLIAARHIAHHEAGRGGVAA